MCQYECSVFTNIFQWVTTTKTKLTIPETVTARIKIINWVIFKMFRLISEEWSLSNFVREQQVEHRRAHVLLSYYFVCWICKLHHGIFVFRLPLYVVIQLCFFLFLMSLPIFPLAFVTVCFIYVIRWWPIPETSYNIFNIFNYI